MNTIWKDVDIVLLLQLHTVLSQDEIQEVLDSLTQDIWFRILNKEIKKNLTPEYYKEFALKHASDKSIDSLVEEIQLLLPQIDMKELLSSVSAFVKKEYTISYIKIMSSSAPKGSNLESKLLNLLAYLETDELDIQELYKNTAEAIKTT